MSKRNIQKGDNVYFHSGNFKGLKGIIMSVDWNSKDEKAIFGFLHTVKLENGIMGYIEKSEHWDVIYF